jgi:hypothetical protein
MNIHLLLLLLLIFAERVSEKDYKVVKLLEPEPIDPISIHANSTAANNHKPPIMSTHTIRTSSIDPATESSSTLSNNTTNPADTAIDILSSCDLILSEIPDSDIFRHEIFFVDGYTDKVQY